MPLYLLRATQTIPVSIEDAWSFFSDPRNLAVITPPSLGLRMTSDVPAAMTEGMIITYRVNVFPGITMSWLTQITRVDKPRAFVDMQPVGPYRYWHHLHTFAPVSGGVRADDEVHFALPFGAIGALAAPLVKARLRQIFTYRARTLERMFGTLPGAPPTLTFTHL